MNRRAVVRRLLVAFVGASGSLPATAQTTHGKPRIGVLRWGASGDDAQGGLTRALAAIGYRDKETIDIEWRFATDRELAARHARELVAMRPDLIVALATPAAIALRDVPRSPPVIMGGAADPVGVGLVASLAKPGGNMTGVSLNLPALVGKHLQLLLEVTPRLQRAAFLGSSDDPATRLFVEQAHAAAATLGVAMQVVLVSQGREFAAAVQAMVRARAQSVVVQPLFATGSAAPLADLLVRAGLPSITSLPQYARSGGLMTYGISREETSRRTASFVDRVLKGANPATLPVEEPTAYELVVNLKTAGKIGIDIPNGVLLRADEVLH